MYTRKELADKVDWEGGIAEAIFSYGISADEVPEEIREDWKKVEALKEVMNRIDYWLW